MKPRHRAALLIVGMYCVLFHFLGFADYLALTFLTSGLSTIYWYGKGVEEMEKIIICQRGVRLKSLYFYGFVVFFFFSCLFLGEPRKIQ